MPPPSSPVPRLSSAPSDVFTVHTIASRSPHRPLVSALMERDGLPPRPLLGDVIATPRHHLASDQKPQGSASTVCHSARLVPASLLFRLMPSPSTPSPAAHHFARLCQRAGRGTGGYIGRFWAMLLPPPRHRSTSNQRPGQRLDGLPSFPPRPLHRPLPSFRW